jgi:NADP+-dependent farnesol dehydrogenase
MEKWRGKNAVVTGASSGIGAAIVRDFANAGINVMALARRVDRLEALKKELKGAPGKVSVQKCDVSNKESVNSAFVVIEKECGTVHVLVNNAGILR